MADRTVLIARHGSREDHEDPRWVLHAENPYDPNVTSRGLQEARQLAGRLARERPA